MNKIYKYEVPVDDEWHELDVPKGYVVHVDCLRYADIVYFWVEFHVDDNAPNKRKFKVFGTGHEIPVHCQYWGTAKVADGALMWHLYEAVS